MPSFADIWSKQENIQDRLKKALRKERRLREKLNRAMLALDRQKWRLGRATNRLASRDKRLFQRMVVALRRRNRRRAALYANELSEVRRLIRWVDQVKLALEQIALRLGTVRDVGDIAAVLAPARRVMESVREGVSRVVPRADREFDEISDLMGSIIVDSAQMGGVGLNFSASNLEAEKILREAENQVEEGIRKKLPSVPATGEEIGSERIKI
ncbi:MAG: Snf7 family protein [Candidatus Bathyarchaeia archaeon]